ncbi:MAG: efflux RND transporter periplasmic adaptor subunit [Pseudomonadales bacterium]
MSLTSFIRSISGAGLLILLLVLLVACGEQNAGPLATGENIPATYQTVTVSLQQVTAERRVNGRVESVYQGTVSAQTAGEVTELVHDVSDEVAGGEVVLRLRAVQQRAGLRQAEAALREANSQLAEAEARYKRIADLVARQLASRAELDEVTAYRDSVRARREAAQAALDSAAEGLAYTEVVMPYAGVITDRHIEIGEVVAPGAPLFDAAALEQLRVISDISQELALQLQQTSRAAVYIGDERIEAVEVTVYPRAADNTATFRVRLDLPGGTVGLLPGMFVMVGIVTGEESNLLVPIDAVVERGEVTGVYVLDPNGRTVFRQVRLGRRQGEMREVLAGLSEGEQVSIEPDLAMRHLFATERSEN